MRQAIICSLMAALCALPIGAPRSFAAGKQDGPSGPQLPGSSRTPLLEKVEDSIARGKRYLLARQNDDGSWGEKDATADHRVGQTALVTLALLNCGESHQSKELAAAVKYLRTTKPNGQHATYATALRACVWATLPEPVRGNSLKADLGWLLTTTIKKPPNDGMHGYAGAPHWPGDFSNSQYGVLGIWYAANAGLEVPTTYWRRVENVWRKHQKEDGGWPYMPNRGDSYASMTAAGAATLYITNDYLHAGETQDLNVPSRNAPLEKAIAWLGENFAVDMNVGRDTDVRRDAGIEEGEIEMNGLRLRFRKKDGGTFVHYMLFGYERVGEASGLTRFGDHRWFDEGAKYLIETQAYDGSWEGSINEICDTSYALLFLSRGRSPVAIQKFQHGERWNNRPRDAANFVRFLRHATERHMNWQIVNADAPLADLREAPILYLAGDRPLELSESQRKLIQTYVNEGGLLLFVNEGPTSHFAQSVTALCKDMWPAYQFKDVAATHPMKAGNFPVEGWTDPIKSLSNGVRDIAILMPSGDVSWKWQAGGGSAQVKMSPYAVLANLLLYLIDVKAAHYKGETTWVDRDGSASDPPRRRFVARLKHDGNWDPEPLAWKRLANILHNSQECALHADTVDLVAGKLKVSYTLAHLTAAGKFDLKPSQRQVLKKYLDDGGTLLFDAAGGSSEATLSFEAMMAALYPGVQNAPLPVDHPIYTGKFAGGRAIGEFQYRRGAPGRLPPTKLPRLRGYTVNGRLVAIESPEDLTAALVGYPVNGITGYTPATAAQLVRNITLWSDAEDR